MGWTTIRDDMKLDRLIEWKGTPVAEVDYCDVLDCWYGLRIVKGEEVVFVYDYNNWEWRAPKPPRPEIKPCPFCGETPILRNRVVSCNNDKCPCAPMTSSSLFKTKEAAIKAWNEHISWGWPSN